MALFAKKTRMPTLEDVARLRSRRAVLAKQLEEAHALANGNNRAIQQLLIEDGEPAALTKMQQDAEKEERHVRSLGGAIAALDSEITATQNEIAAAANKKLRTETAAILENHAKDVAAAALSFTAGAKNFADATGKVAGAIWEIQQMHNLAAGLVEDVGTASALAESLIRDHAKAVLSGSAPASLAKPDAHPVSAAMLQPTKRVFALAPLRCPGKSTARYQDVEMPAEYADRALALGYAIDPTDERTRPHRNGFAAAPALTDCIDLTNSALEPFKPVFGADRIKQAARFEETIGPAQHGFVGGA